MTSSLLADGRPKSLAGCYPSAPAPTLEPMTSLYTIETAGRLEPHVAQEWLLTNGLGAFASSTVVGCNIRRYHGLLIAATLPPVGRVMGLNRVGERLVLDGNETRAHEFSINRFRDNYFPRGDQY